MTRIWIAAVALGFAGVPGAALAQDGAALDCVAKTISPDLRAQVGAAMAGSDSDAARPLFEQFGALSTDCMTKNGIAADRKEVYFDYNLARVSREWFAGQIRRAGLSVDPVDRSLDFGPKGANPDLSSEMTEDQINTIINAYTAAGVDVESVDQSVWEKVGAYAAASSIYWNRRQQFLSH